MRYGVIVYFTTVVKESDKDNIVQQFAVVERRKTLPSPEVASGDIGLWSILRKNIGE